MHAKNSKVLTYCIMLDFFNTLSFGIATLNSNGHNIFIRLIKPNVNYVLLSVIAY